MACEFTIKDIAAIARCEYREAQRISRVLKAPRNGRWRRFSEVDCLLLAVLCRVGCGWRTKQLRKAAAQLKVNHAWALRRMLAGETDIVTLAWPRTETVARVDDILAALAERKAACTR